MAEQANVQARKKAARKNNSAPESGEGPMAQPQIQTVMAVVVPEEIFAMMKDMLRKLPRDQTELLWSTMTNLRPQPVNMQLQPGQQPQG